MFCPDTMGPMHYRTQVHYSTVSYDGFRLLRLPPCSLVIPMKIVRNSPPPLRYSTQANLCHHFQELQIFYDYASTSMKNDSTLRNTTDIDYSKPLTMGFIGPSITPLTGNNAGYQRLQVDTRTFSVMGYQTYFANVSESLTWDTPIWQFEYDARNTYNVGNVDWPATAPLNATFYDRVTSQMLQNNSLVETYNLLETKSSVVTKNCSSAACTSQKVCYIRSGSAALGLKCGKKNGPF